MCIRDVVKGVVKDRSERTIDGAHGPCEHKKTCTETLVPKVRF